MSPDQRTQSAMHMNVDIQHTHLSFWGVPDPTPTPILSFIILGLLTLPPYTALGLSNLPCSCAFKHDPQQGECIWRTRIKGNNLQQTESGSTDPKSHPPFPAPRNLSGCLFSSTSFFHHVAPAHFCAGFGKFQGLETYSFWSLVKESPHSPFQLRSFSPSSGRTPLKFIMKIGLALFVSSSLIYMGPGVFVL